MNLINVDKSSCSLFDLSTVPDYDAEAEKWLKKNDQLLGEKSHEEVVASWNYMTDLTDANAKKVGEHLPCNDLANLVHQC